ncbi:hypothetical protein E2C01_079183 [Portunus trituberculatus]|uniref:Uncharacterized protein n=1 Tax=Portunus trituberculatus TaxID=210409 RepID=A0A5B7IPM0_PORTR|nr:hypothetical protein [Portunus trituberculatus]
MKGECLGPLTAPHPVSPSTPPPSRFGVLLEFEDLLFASTPTRITCGSVLGCGRDNTTSYPILNTLYKEPERCNVQWKEREEGSIYVEELVC